MNTATEPKLYRIAANGDEIGEMTVDDMLEATLAHTLPENAVYWQAGPDRWRPIAQIIQPRIDEQKSARPISIPIPSRVPDPRPSIAPHGYVWICRIVAVLTGLVAAVAFWLLQWIAAISLFFRAFFFLVLGEIIALLACIEFNTRRKE